MTAPRIEETTLPQHFVAIGPADGFTPTLQNNKEGGLEDETKPIPPVGNDTQSAIVVPKPTVLPSRTNVNTESADLEGTLTTNITAILFS